MTPAEAEAAGWTVEQTAPSRWIAERESPFHSESSNESLADLLVKVSAYEDHLAAFGLPAPSVPWNNWRNDPMR